MTERNHENELGKKAKELGIEVRVKKSTPEEIKSLREHFRLVRLERETAEQNLAQWIEEYPKFRDKWVAVRGGKPVCPGNNVYDVSDKYEVEYNESPRFMVFIGKLPPVFVPHLSIVSPYNLDDKSE